MNTGKIVEWLKKEGDLVRKGEPILVVEGEKTTFEIEAPEGGVLSELWLRLEATSKLPTQSQSSANLAQVLNELHDEKPFNKKAFKEPGLPHKAAPAPHPSLLIFSGDRIVVPQQPLEG